MRTSITICGTRTSRTCFRIRCTMCASFTICGTRSSRIGTETKISMTGSNLHVCALSSGAAASMKGCCRDPPTSSSSTMAKVVVPRENCGSEQRRCHLLSTSVSVATTNGVVTPFDGKRWITVSHLMATTTLKGQARQGHPGDGQRDFAPRQLLLFL